MAAPTTDLIDIDDLAAYVPSPDERGERKRHRRWSGSVAGDVWQGTGRGVIGNTAHTHEAPSFPVSDLSLHVDALRRSASQLAAAAKARDRSTGFIALQLPEVLNQPWPLTVLGSPWHPALGPIRALASEHEEYDDDFARPTVHALRTAENLLVEAWKDQRHLPRYVAAMPGDGGLRIYFDHEAKHLSVAIPSHEGGRAYIYHEYGEDYGVDQDVSSDGLLRWLDWLADL